MQPAESRATTSFFIHHRERPAAGGSRSGRHSHALRLPEYDRSQRQGRSGARHNRHAGNQYRWSLLERRLVPYVNDLRVDHGVSIELCIYGHSRGRELFLYSGDEYAPVKNIGENMDIAVLVRIKKSGRTTRVLFVKASGEGEEQLFNNAAREIAIGLSAAGLGAGATTKP